MPRSNSWPLLAACALACAPALRPPDARGEGKKPAPAPPASSSAPAPRFDPGVAPDPEPLVTQKKWLYELVYHEGAVFSPTPRPVEHPRPSATPRRHGRFAIELYNGPDLIERVRFDLPMLDGATRKPRALNAPPDLERGVRVKTRVEVPATDRANRAFFIDRATNVRVRLPWRAS